MTFEKLNTIMKWKEIPAFIQPFEILIKKGFSHFEPIEFEQFILNIFECFGFSGELTPITGDGGVDIIIREKEGISVVQCKRYNDNSNIGVQDVREFLGAMVHYNAMYGYFVTTSNFSEAANNFTDDHNNLLLIGQRALERFYRLSILSVTGNLESQ